MFRIPEVKSEFLKNVTTLMTGTVLAQLLPILFAPVMTRIFDPEDYGFLALYMAVSGLLSIFITSHYNHAILLPRNDRESINLVFLCVVLTVIFTLTSLVVLLLIGKSFFGLEALGWWAYVIPVSVFFSGVGASLNNWVNRRRRYKCLALSRIAAPVISIPLQLCFGLLYKGPLGLMIGLLIGQIASSLVLFTQVWREDFKIFNKKLSAYRIKYVLYKYRQFLQYSFPADFINRLINQMPVLLLSKYAGSVALGNYNLSQRMLGLPSAFISSSLIEVFRERANSDYKKFGNCREIFLKTLKTLFLVGIAPLLILIIFAPNLFAIAFGDKWVTAGEYARILSPFFFLRFIVSPLSYVYFIVNKQREDFYLHILILIVTILSFVAGYFHRGTIEAMLIYYSASYSFVYVIYLFRSYMFSGGLGGSHG